MISKDQIDRLEGATGYDDSGDKVGKAGQVYLDDTSGEPTWVTVNTCLFGTSESFVPVEGARFDGTDRLDVAYSKAKIKDAPNMATEGTSSRARSRRSLTTTACPTAAAAAAAS